MTGNRIALDAVDAIAVLNEEGEAGSWTEGYDAEIRLELKRKGKPIPENDLWIAAICKQHNLPLSSLDDHFSNVNGLTVVKRQ